MAILRGQDGKFYDLDDAALEGNEVQPENLPEGAEGGPPEGGAGGEPGAGIVQIFVNAGGGAGGPAGASSAAPPSEGEGGDVEGHSRCGWHNHWRNWRNWRNCSY